MNAAHSKPDCSLITAGQKMIHIKQISNPLLQTVNRARVSILKEKFSKDPERYHLRHDPILPPHNRSGIKSLFYKPVSAIKKRYYAYHYINYNIENKTIQNRLIRYSNTNSTGIGSKKWFGPGRGGMPDFRFWFKK